MSLPLVCNDINLGCNLANNIQGRGGGEIAQGIWDFPEEKWERGGRWV